MLNVRYSQVFCSSYTDTSFTNLIYQVQMTNISPVGINTDLHVPSSTFSVFITTHACISIIIYSFIICIQLLTTVVGRPVQLVSLYNCFDIWRACWIWYVLIRIIICIIYFSSIGNIGPRRFHNAIWCRRLAFGFLFGLCWRFGSGSSPVFFLFFVPLVL